MDETVCGTNEEEGHREGKECKEIPRAPPLQSNAEPQEQERQYREDGDEKEHPEVTV